VTLRLAAFPPGFVPGTGNPVARRDTRDAGDPQAVRRSRSRRTALEFVAEKWTPVLRKDTRRLRTSSLSGASERPDSLEAVAAASGPDAASWSVGSGSAIRSIRGRAKAIQ
jgi:hypothetical protein